MMDGLAQMRHIVNFAGKRLRCMVGVEAGQIGSLTDVHSAGIWFWVPAICLADCHRLNMQARDKKGDSTCS